MRRAFALIVPIALGAAIACGGSSSNNRTPTSGAGPCGVPATSAAAGSCAGVTDETPVVEATTASGGAAAQLTIASFSGIEQDGLTLGRADAPLKINLYQNFLCPHCRDFALNMLPRLIADYVAPGKASITFHDTALGGIDADTAHNAAHCAADQGKFWPAYAVLYQNFSDVPGTYAKAHLEALLSRTGVDATSLAACMDSDQHKAEVDASTEAFGHLADGSPVYASELATVTAEEGPAIPLLEAGGTYLTAPENYADIRAAIDAKVSR